MKIILLSGGSGKRLWPLSNEARSKQFLKVLKNLKGQKESMFQRVCRQLEQVGLKEKFIISASLAQQDIILNQLSSSVPLILEPERRDTFPAIALASSYLYSFMDMSLDDVVIVLPVDSYVEDHFFYKVKELEQVFKYADIDLSLVGVKPAYPSEKYGYIIPEKKVTLNNYTFYQVSHFKEKPSEEQASLLIKQNAFWNCGIFAFKLGFMISLLQNKNLPCHYKELLTQYNNLPKVSFDYEVVEKLKRVAMVPYNGYWKDLGTWDTLTEKMETHVTGKGKVCEKSYNTHVVNELDIPVLVFGISDAVVAASPDGILVTGKWPNTKLKEYLVEFEQRPMYEEKRWGWYKVLHYKNYVDNQKILTKHLGLFSGSNFSYQKHFKRIKVWTIISGEGESVIEGELKFVKPGDVVQIPVNVKHALKAHTDLELIEVQIGSELIEEDIELITTEWEEIVNMLKEE
ncbi:sugar phosphate nucleotidyltransferase [Metabacillus herbersteinensis]|uniref:Sugar phosphate nucleotidyltransferase n=1 Tax=Metabacillus herbersteinensis TaxID=283816 RepID=A0ABV6GE27_9BACI